MPIRPLLLAALICASRATPAQDFPAPGTGPLTFESVGNESYREDIIPFAFAAEGTLYGFADSLYRFEPAPDGLPAGRWRAISKPGNAIGAVTTVGATADTLLAGRASTMYRSVNGGVSWSVVNGNLSGEGNGGPNQPDAFFALPAHHSNAGRLLAGGAILYSDDRGATWTEAVRAFPGVTNGRAYAFAALPSGRVLMAGAWGVAASDDGGASYTATPLWGEYLYETYSIVALATPGSTQSGAPACGQADPALCDGAVVIGIDATAPYVRAWRTNDGGRSWSEPVPMPQPEDGVGSGSTAGVVNLTPGVDGLGRALMVGMRGVIYRTADGAQTWEAIGRMPLYLGSPSHSAQLARIGPDGHLWVSTVRNGAITDFMYRSAQPAEAAFIVAGEAGPPEQAGARLSVRPNPSSSTVLVTLELNETTASAAVSVYDAVGRRVTVLHDGLLPAGSHVFRLESSGLAPGVYTVRVAESASATFTIVR